MTHFFKISLVTNFVVMGAVALLVYLIPSLWWTLPASVLWLGPYFVFCSSPKWQDARIVWNSVAWGLALGTLLRL